ncbi:MAG: bifunctional DNA-formamidopyrimidine glycosylase/DNA-(apurinic or apyrimidinic site) lyase [bacterium]|nr:bifunctional DNA-formamidopyrimidine glycosylase/DNA-(apurinic or apyrimidinic site) lyase [bacterium]
MPELPEVETVVRGLRKIIPGRVFEAVKTNAPAASIVISPSFKRKTLNSVIKGRKVLSIDRRGKNILINLAGDVTLWVHLKMTGKFLYVDRTQPKHKHDLVFFDFTPHTKDDNGLHLRFNDYRRFGRLRVFPNDELWQQPGLANLGPEPLDLTANDFVELCKRRARMIKPALLDQNFIAGLGNIYADESLYVSKIHPRRLTDTLSRRKLTELHGHIQRLLRASIEHMGTTVVSHAGVDGRSGSFQNFLKVYGSEDQPCDHCGGNIIREKIGSRSAHYCPRCQRLR